MSQEEVKIERVWWKEVVFYQIYPLSFCDTNKDGLGDIRGIISKLPYLKDLGVGGLWISPMCASPMVDNGYDISDYDMIDPRFGTMEDFDEMIRTAHAQDIHIIMDLVVNHTSDQHPWFQESRASRDNDKSDWYIWHDGKDGGPPNNWAADTGGSAWTYDSTRGQYYLHLFSSSQPDLNWHNADVKEEIFAMMRRWLRRGVDGFRLDMGNFFLKADGFPDAPRKDGDMRAFIHGEALYANQPGIHEIYKRMQNDVLAPFGAIAFGEMYFLSPEEGLKYVGHDRGEVNLLYQYHIMDTRGDWPGVKYHTRIWAEAFADKAQNSITFSNHDSPRSVSIFGDSVHHHEKSAKLIMTYLLSAPGTPFMLQGEEIGMTNTQVTDARDLTDIKMRGAYDERIAAGDDPEDVLAELSWWNRDNARTPMQWTSGEHAGFSDVLPWLRVNPNHTEINVAAQQKDPYSIYNYAKTLIQIKKDHPALSYGAYEPLRPDEWTVYLSARTLGSERIISVFNFSSEENSINMPEELQQDGVELLLSNYEVKSDSGDRLVMRPWEARVYKMSV